MKIALIGASGNVGQRVTAEAVSRGHDVIAIARNVDSIAATDMVTPVKADMTNQDEIVAAIGDADVLVLSVRFQGLDFEPVLRSIEASGVSRLLIVGGAASLYVAPGVQLIDTEGFPDFIKVEAEPARQALNRLADETAVNWTFLSPSVFFGPGERTGTFRLGTDELLTAADGKSSISYEDFSIALLDEIEVPEHEGARFTVGY